MFEREIPALVAVIGASHLLQPPLTRLLARRLDLAASFRALPALPGRIAENMALASVAVPTTLGVWLAVHSEQALVPGAVREIGVLLGLFWCWRLTRQLGALRRAWDPSHRRWHWLLTAIFVVQGPILLAVLALA